MSRRRGGKLGGKASHLRVVRYEKHKNLSSARMRKKTAETSQKTKQRRKTRNRPPMIQLMLTQGEKERPVVKHHSPGGTRTKLGYYRDPAIMECRGPSSQPSRPEKLNESVFKTFLETTKRETRSFQKCQGKHRKLCRIVRAPYALWEGAQSDTGRRRLKLTTAESQRWARKDGGGLSGDASRGP